MAQGYKTGGREAGTPNKATSQMREAITKALTLIDGDPVQFQSDIEALTPSERLKFYVALLEYVQPKLARTEYKTDAVVDNRPQIIVQTQEQADILEEFLNYDE